MNIIITKNVDNNSADKKIPSKDIICPECNENILIDFENFKVSYKPYLLHPLTKIKYKI